MRRPKTVVGLAVLASAAILGGSLRVKRPDAPSLAGEVVAATKVASPMAIPISEAAERASKAARATLKRSAAKLDSTYARFDHIEGLLHVVQALDAWDVRQLARAAEELRTAADNLERGAKHGGLKLDARALAAAANARAAARRLQQSGELAGDEFWQVTHELDAQLRRLGARIGRTN